MNRETIEKAARKLLKGIVPCEWNQQPLIDIFVDAARWRINSVWHDMSECKDVKRKILVEYKNGRFDALPDIRDLKGVEDLVERVAYIDELLPDGKEVRP